MKTPEEWATEAVAGLHGTVDAGMVQMAHKMGVDFYARIQRDAIADLGDRIRAAIDLLDSIAKDCDGIIKDIK